MTTGPGKWDTWAERGRRGNVIDSFCVVFYVVLGVVLCVVHASVILQAYVVFMLRRRWFFAVALAGATMATALAQTKQDTKTGAWGVVDFSGTVGASRIGMLFDLGKATAVPPHFSASYFYTRHLTDIPLDGALNQSGGYTLVEKDADGRPRATFTLFPTENSGKRVADLSVATGLQGTWKSVNGRTLPVTLAIADSQPGATAATRYGTSPGADTKVEGHARRFLAAVESGDRTAAEREVSFPLRANVVKQQIKDAAQLDLKWTTIFTPSYVACLKTLVPHNLFTNAEGSMMGDGAVWLDSSGIISLNPCTTKPSQR